MKEQHQFECHVRRLLQEFAFIRDLHDIVQAQIADIVVHQSHHAGHIVYHEGDPPDAGCYIIISGEVQVWQNPGRDDDPKKHSKTAPCEEGSASVRRHAEGILSLLEEEEQTMNMKEKGSKKTAVPLLEIPGKVLIRSFGAGMMFGEVGLLEDQPSFATFRLKTDCEFLHINKGDFDRLMKKSTNQLRFKKLAAPMRQFLKEFAFFRNLDRPVQAHVHEIMHYQRYRAGSVIFKEGDPPRNCFILLSGAVNLYSRDAPETDGVKVELALDGMKASRAALMKCAAMLTRLHEDEEYAHSSHWVDNGQMSASDIKRLGSPISRLGPAHLLGENALLEGRCQINSAACASDCELLCIHKNDFDTLLKKTMQEAHMALPALVEPLLKKIPFFEKFRESVLENVAYAMRYHMEPKGKVIFWEGDPPGSCFLILSGVVSVWKRTGEAGQVVSLAPPELISADPEVCEHCDKVCDGLAAMDKPQSLNDLISKAKDLEKRKNEVEEERRNKRTNRKSSAAITELFGIQVASLGTGIVFGEQALIDDAPRNATLTCEDGVRLLCLSRADFDRIVKQDLIKVKLKALSSQIRRLLREFDLFKELSTPVQDSLADIIRYIRAPTGAVLFEQGDSPNFCYICLSGEVTVWNNKNYWTPRPSGRPRTETVAAPTENQNEQDSKALSLIFKHQLRPSLESASALAREKCAALASILSGVCGMNGASSQEDLFADDSVVRTQSEAVAALGSGTLFGELALLNDNPRSATISCYKNSEFLVIEKDDFDRLLKSELNRAKEEKLLFLRTHVPGVRDLQPKNMDSEQAREQAARSAERLLYYFNKEIVPKNHAFIEQGGMLMGDIFFVWQGSVESYTRLPNGGLRRRGILLRGSVFAAVPANTPSTFTVVATSSPCEVLHLRPEFRKQIPEIVMHSIKDSIDQTFARRMIQCSPLEPMSFETSPLTFLKPQKSPSRTRERHPRRTCLVPSTTDLFQRIHPELDHEACDIASGDAGYRGNKVKRRGLHESMSAPQLRPTSSQSALRLDSPMSPANKTMSKILHVEA